MLRDYTKVEVKFCAGPEWQQVMFIHNADLRSDERFRRLRWHYITDESFARLVRVCNADKAGIEVTDCGWQYSRSKSSIAKCPYGR